MEWISIKDRLPEDNQWIVFCVSGCDESLCGCYDSVFKKEFFVGLVSKDSYSMDNITHWIPLPEPPETRMHNGS